MGFTIHAKSVGRCVVPESSRLRLALWGHAKGKLSEGEIDSKGERVSEWGGIGNRAGEGRCMAKVRS